MFKAKIVTNNNGKQTVIEFDDEKEYYDYLESHQELNQSLNRNVPIIPTRNLGRLEDMNKLMDWTTQRSLGHNAVHHLSPIELVKRDIQRLELEDKKKEREKEEEQKRKEQEKKDLEEAKALLNNYQSKHGHNPEYVRRLQEEVERLEKRLS